MRQNHNKHAGKKNKRNGNIGISDNFDPIVPVKKEPPPLRALNQAQYDYIESIENNSLTFGVGSAGSGKSFVAGAIAAQMLKDGEIDKIIITRPCVEAGEKLGFVPGLLEEKYEEFIHPFIDVLNQRLGKSQVAYYRKTGHILAKPLGYMRGVTLDNAFMILDEAQNCTVALMKMYLTRIGKDAICVVNGDISQKDINTLSGLQDAVNRLENVKDIGIVNFHNSDCVRSGLCRAILERYEE